jgi:hypothetical protein
LGSGKSVATGLLRKEFGYTEVNSGRVLADILGIPPVPETPRDVFQAKAWAFIQRSSGPARLARAIWRRVEIESKDKLLIDGIRQRTTLGELKKLAGDRSVALLYVYTPPTVAYKFFKGRSKKSLSIYDFLKVSDSPVEAEVRSMIRGADAVLYNWSGEPLYKDAVRELMHEILDDAGNLK